LIVKGVYYYANYKNGDNMTVMIIYNIIDYNGYSNSSVKVKIKIIVVYS
jgi:hypothetical protein